MAGLVLACPGGPRRHMAGPFPNSNDLVGSDPCYTLKLVLRLSAWMAGTGPAMTESDVRAQRALAVTHRLYLSIFALIAFTSSVDISPSVVTLPSTIFHRRNGPVMSPN
jgi:hypothetical protein